MVILGASIFYTKLVIKFEHQNPYEAFYAINTLLIVMFAITMSCRDR